MERFEQYLRFKPDMKLKYVYYYDTTANPMLDRRFPNATLREKMVEVCKIYGLDSNKFMAPEEIRKIIDLSEKITRSCVRLFVKMVKKRG
ncbi:MAG: hypothetical protein ACLU4N_18025 [Butyricimonas faecihominis]